MADFKVELKFDDGSNSYTFPLVQAINDPNPGMKATVIKGNRASGSIVIPGGKESIEINVEGILFDNDGYEDITTKMNEMRSKVSTNPATLTLKHFNGSTWVNDWSYVGRRITRIDFSKSNDLRTTTQPYKFTFLITSY